METRVERGRGGCSPYKRRGKGGRQRNKRGRSKEKMRDGESGEVEELRYVTIVLHHCDAPVFTHLSMCLFFDNRRCSLMLYHFAFDSH